MPGPDDEINPGGGIGKDGFLKKLKLAPPLGSFFGARSKSLIFGFFLVVSLFFSTYVSFRSQMYSQQRFYSLVAENAERAIPRRDNFLKLAFVHANDIIL